MQSNDNKYLQSILMPFHVKARVPDLDMTSSVLKTVKLVRNINMGESGEMLIVYVPHSKRSVLRLYGWETTLQKYIFWKAIDYDEKLTQNFELARFVSGAMKVKSATTSGGQFDISGVISASQYQDLPDISNLRFENISSYTRDSVNSIATDVQDGVVTLAHPDGSHKFVPYDTNAAYSLDATLCVASEVNGAGGLWAEDDATIFDSDRDPSFIPPNLWGHTEVNVHLCFRSNLAGTGIYTLRLEGDIINDTFVGSSVVFNASSCRLTVSGNNYYSTTLRVKQDSTWPIRRILVTCNTGSAFSVLIGAGLDIRNETYYQRGSRGPGTLIGLQAVTPNQKVYFNGVGNFEVVPNAELSRNLTTNYSGVENPFDMEMAEVFVQKMPRLGLCMIDTISKYDMAIAQRIYHDMTDRTQLGQASGFMDWIRSLWSEAKPLIRGLAPAIGSVFGPEGAIIGSSVGRLLAAPGKAAGVYEYGKAGMMGDANYINGINHYKAGIRNVTTKLQGAKVISLNTFTNKGDNFVVASILKSKGFRISSIINKAIFPYLVGTDVHFGSVYSCGDPLASSDDAQTYAGYKYPDDRWVMISSTHGLDEEAVASIVAAVDTAEFLSITYVHVVSKHPITQGSLGLAAYSAVIGINPNAPVTGAIIRGEMFTPSNVEAKARVTNAMGRTLLIAGVSPPATAEDIYNAHSLSKGRVTARGGTLHGKYYLLNPACLTVFTLLQLPTSLVSKVDLVESVHKDTGAAIYSASYKGPTSQKVEISWPIYIDMQTGQIVPNKTANTKQYTKEKMLNIKNYYHIINSKAFKSGEMAVMGLPPGQEPVLQKKMDSFTSDDIKSLARILANSYRTTHSIIASKTSSGTKRPGLAPNLQPQEALNIAALIPPAPSQVRQQQQQHVQLTPEEQTQLQFDQIPLQQVPEIDSNILSSLFDH